MNSQMQSGIYWIILGLGKKRSIKSSEIQKYLLEESDFSAEVRVFTHLNCLVYFVEVSPALHLIQLDCKKGTLRSNGNKARAARTDYDICDL